MLVHAPTHGIIEEKWISGVVHETEDDCLVRSLYPKYLETLDCADELKSLILSAYLHGENSNVRH